jgi:uncharacterized membrane protein YfcA
MPGVTGNALEILTITAFATSVLSAVVGMAGGMTLLGVMLLFLDPLAAIPLHAVVQLVSNGSRTFYQREHVDWRIARSFVLPLLPAGALGLLLARRLPPDTTRIAIAGLVLVATWRPHWLALGAKRTSPSPARRFFGLGSVIGFLNVNVGATGVLMAPFFLGLGLTRQALIGSQAVCQMAGHLAKILLFGAAGFAYREHAVLLVSLCASSLAGARVGTWLLDRVSEDQFTWLYKAVLTLLAAQLLFESAGALRT